MITTDKELQELVELSFERGIVAIDTEFVWEKTYYPALGLVQLGLSETECFLVDTLAIKNPEPLKKLLESPNVIKVFHDAVQDLKILQQYCNALPKNIFDTQKAAGFAGLASTISLANLIKEKLGILLEKTQTRTNWLRRPLSKQQQDYALDDVRYMIKIKEMLDADIAKKGLTTWVEEDFAIYEQEETYYDKDPRITFRKVKGSGRLQRRELAILRELYCFREEEAKNGDITKNHLIHDRTLLALSNQIPKSKQDLQGFKALTGKKSRYVPGVLEAVDRALNLPEDEYPTMMSRVPAYKFASRFEEKLRVVMDYIKLKSDNIAIDYALIGNKASISSLVGNSIIGKSVKNNKIIAGWRNDFVGKDICDFAQDKIELFANK